MSAVTSQVEQMLLEVKSRVGYRVYFHQATDEDNSSDHS